jgi:tetratricopeptide (TPR) repeat protein
MKQVDNFIGLSINAKDIQDVQKNTMYAIQLLEKFTTCLDPRDYLLLDSKPYISKEIYIDSFFNLGTLYKSFVENKIDADITKNDADITKNVEMFRKSINAFTNILRISFENDLALKQITSVYTQLCMLYQNEPMTCLQYLQEALLYTPTNAIIHYNLGFIYQRLNKLELSLIHYKISLKLVGDPTEVDTKENENLLLNNYNGISGIYRSIKQWPEALHYLLKAQEISGTDPDINASLGVVYTEMRRTDLAEIAYNCAISNYKNAFISPDPTYLLAQLYLNLGHMHSYNGDNDKSIECYNKSLKVNPKFALPFQNKIMNLNYIFDRLSDKMYIYNQHKLVNKLYPKGKYAFNKEFFNCPKINIGIISGDFVDHPVSFFISTFIKNFDSSRFNITCYSECIINTSLFNKDLNFKTIKFCKSKTALQPKCLLSIEAFSEA